MIRTYRILAHVIAALVGVQAASHAWSSAGLGLYVMNGGVIDKSMMEDTGGPLPFPEVLGILIHGLNGGIVIPAVALALLVISFFTKAKGTILWAGIVLAVVALQMTLGYEGHGLPLLALFHGLNALVLFSVALNAGRVARHRAIALADPSTNEDLATV